ncbi:MAG: iron-sulfur cluster binding protein [Nitrospirae bacterium]|nr:MAG: iron-sulfur cluster binding protein [Nitrospirota bacterium]
MNIKLATGEEISIAEGENILSALKRHGKYLISSCGGKGTCGKCRVKVLSGKYRTAKAGKISKGDRDKGIVLACQTVPEQEISVELLESSRLVIGDKIALSKSKDLAELFKSLDGKISPIVNKVSVKLPPPSIEDHISDLERLKRELNTKGMTGMRFSHGFVLSMADSMRSSGWDIDLAHVNGAEAIFITDRRDTSRYGLAVDIGTTTIVVYLIDFSDGRLVDVGMTYNSQIRHGDDVITRIIYATERGGLNELRDVVAEDINNLIRTITEKHKIKPGHVESAVVSGNTTMSHIFWGIDPRYIREEPYIPAVNFFPLWKAGTARLNINKQAPVYTLPCVASYVGGDIVSGVLASRMHRSSEIALFMDIGTNGEIAVGNNEWLMTAACSAGPCFEGSGIKHGMRATEGAIEAIKIAPDTFEPSFSVIGNTTPTGICGSGMIDAISEMLLTGVIDQRGKFVRDIKTDRIQEGDEGPEFVFCRGEKDVVLTEVDIENVLRAKAAIYAGISLLIKEVGFTLDSIERIYVAGGFGNYLNVDKAIILGMLPDLPKEKFMFLGNTSIAGAYLCLLSEKLRKEAEDIAHKMTYMELSVSRNFMDEYMSALFLPHTDIGLFPTVEKLLKAR